MGDVAQEVHRGQAEQLRVRPEERERPHRVGALEAQLLLAPLGGKRFRQDEEAVERVQQAEGPGEPERETRIPDSEPASERGPQHEADAEGGAQQAEGRGALLGRRHVADVGGSGGNARGGDSGEDAAHEEPAQGGGEGHDDVVETEAQVGQQDDRPPPEAIGEQAEQGREDELHERPHRGEEADGLGGTGGVAPHEVDDQPRQHGDDEAEGQHVEQHGDEDEAQGGAARSRLGGHEGFLCKGGGGGFRKHS